MANNLNYSIAKNLREELKKFPLYKDEQDIQAIIKSHYYIRYSHNNNVIENIPMTRFDIEIGPGVGYILDFNIEKKERRKGYGKLLASIIEDFCIKEFNCKKFITTPSGLAKKYRFWEKRGFKCINNLEVEKLVE